MSTTELLPETEQVALPVFPDGYEVVNGEIVEPPPMSAYATEVASRLRDELTRYAFTTGSGRARNEVMFRFPLPEDPERDRRPDVSFLSYESWPADKPMPFRGEPWDVVPEFACEVVSPNDEADAVIDKALEYLRAGVKLVWVVFPKARQVYTYTSPSPRAYGPGERLDGGDVLPGFQLPVDTLFPPVAAPRG